jgi:hypothetical protein
MSSDAAKQLGINNLYFPTLAASKKSHVRSSLTADHQRHALVRSVPGAVLAHILCVNQIQTAFSCNAL